MVLDLVSERGCERLSIVFTIWKMLMDALKTMVNNPSKESFYEKRKK